MQPLDLCLSRSSRHSSVPPWRVWRLPGSTRMTMCQTNIMRHVDALHKRDARSDGGLLSLATIMTRGRGKLRVRREILHLMVDFRYVLRQNLCGYGFSFLCLSCRKMICVSSSSRPARAARHPLARALQRQGASSLIPPKDLLRNQQKPRRSPCRGAASFFGSPR